MTSVPTATASVPRVHALEFEHVAKRYPGVVALDDVSAYFDAGEVVGLVGKNGAGKSTLMKVMAGAIQPDEGVVRLAGTVQHFDSPRSAVRAGIAVVHQELATVGDLTAAENVFLGLGYPSAGPFVRWKQLYADANQVLEELGLPGIAHLPARRLSAVQLRLTMIAHALARKAKIIALDEPSASLPPAELETLHGVVRSLKARGVGIIYISHRLEEVLDLSSRVVVMRDGSVIESIDRADLTRPRLVELISGESAARAQQRRSAARATERPKPANDGSVLFKAASVRGPGVRGADGLEVAAGEIVGIAGLVGSGRSRLLRALFGADPGASTRCSVEGVELEIRKPIDAIRAGVVLLPEDRPAEGNVLDMSVRQNITLPSLRKFRSFSRAAVPSRAREAAWAAQVIDDLQIKTASQASTVRQLSGGNQQKVMIGKWLARSPKVLMFDEPTQGIDVGAKQEVFALLETLAAAGKGVLLVSSDFSELIDVCDRVLVMHAGRIVAQLTGDDLTEKSIVEACYAGAS